MEHLCDLWLLLMLCARFKGYLFTEYLSLTVFIQTHKHLLEIGIQTLVYVRLNPRKSFFTSKLIHFFFYVGKTNFYLCIFKNQNIMPPLFFSPPNLSFLHICGIFVISVSSITMLSFLRF